MSKYQIHVSGLNMLARCGEQYRRRYIEGDVIPPGVAMVVGTSVHESVAADLRHWIESDELLPDEAIPDIAAGSLDRRWQEGVKLSDDEAKAGLDRVRGEAVDRVVRLAGFHHQAVAPALRPKHVERPFVLDVKGYDFQITGTMDIQEPSAVRDTKTKQSSPPKDAADRSIQLPAYALGVEISDGRRPEQVSLDCLVDLKRGPKFQRLESTIRDSDIGALLARVANWHRAIEAGVFTPADPDSWVCSRRWCGWYEQCAYSRKPVQSGGLVTIEPATDLPGDRPPPGESTHPPSAQQPTPAPGGPGRAAGDERPNPTQGVTDAVADSAGSVSSPSEPDAPAADFSTTNEAAKPRKSNPQPPAKPVAPRPQIPGAALLW